MKILVIDDLRSFPGEDITYARSSATALDVLEVPDGWDEVWFDHDLGGDDTTIPVLDRICELAATGSPLRIGRAVIHTSNSAGRDTLRRGLERWGYQVRVIDAVWAGATVEGSKNNPPPLLEQGSSRGGDEPRS